MKRSAFRPNPQRATALAELMKFFEPQSDGSKISYIEIERATGLPMRDRAHRSLVRHALRKLKRPYIGIVDFGVELSSRDNVGEIVARQQARVSSAIRGAIKVDGLVLQRHGQELTSHQRDALGRHHTFLLTLEAHDRETAKLLPPPKE